MKQMSDFISEIPADLKLVVVDALRILCLKFPAKHEMILNIMSSTLRADGSYDLKRAIVEGMFDIAQLIPAAKVLTLDCLGEFAEDCEYVRLGSRILHFLGQHASRSDMPTQYIRLVYNRAIVDPSVVRAAAISSLFQFASVLPENYRNDISVLLKRFVAFYDPSLISNFLLPVAPTNLTMKGESEQFSSPAFSKTKIVSSSRRSTEAWVGFEFCTR